MRDQGLNRYAAPWERLRASFDAEANKPTLVQTAEELLATERAPRTLPVRHVNESLLELEERLADTTLHADPRFGANAGANGVILDDAGRGARPEGELEAAYDDAWSPAPRSNEPSHIGQVIDNRYVVESLIARGGMGIVYRCRHKLIDRRFAVKIIRSTMAHLPDAPRRFLMEAKAASAIGNEHIIDVVDYGTLADGSAYLVMELLEGVPLSDVIAKHETLPVGRIAAIAAQMCEGLRAAHEAGIVHRDLKPENIFLTHRKANDFVKILDFGIAKMAQSGEALTKKGLIVGTPHYMSPEQAAGATVDARGDIYSLGVILYELATGRVPFDAVHYMAVLAKHMTEPPPPFHTLSLPAPLPSEFESIVLRCLAKRPEQRFQTMTDVLGALEQLGVRLRSPSRPSIEASLPLAPLATTDDTSRGTGQSVPAAPSRGLLTEPKRRGLGLLIPALGLAVLTGISVFRMRGDDELHAARSARASGARAPASSRREPAEPRAGLAAPSTPLASTTASLAPAPGGVTEASASVPGTEAASGTQTAPAAPEQAGADGDAIAGRTDPAMTAAPGAPADDEGDEMTGPLTTMEPLTVELTPGKSVEIEARTRLRLRLPQNEQEQQAAEAPTSKRASGRKGAKRAHAAGATRSRTSGERAAGEKGQTSDVPTGSGDPPSGGSGNGSKADGSKSGGGRAGGGKAGAGKTERGGEARARSELMNPWPSP